MSILSTIASDLENIPGQIVAGVTSLIVGIPEKEIAIFAGAAKVAEADLAAGKTYGQAWADTLTYIYNQEGTFLRSEMIALLNIFVTVQAATMPAPAVQPA